MRPSDVIRDSWRDVVCGIRTLKNRPALSMMVVFTAALGIGANTSIFSVVKAVLLRPLPYKDSGRLFVVTNINPKEVALELGVPDFQYFAWRSHRELFDGLAAYQEGEATLSGAGQAQRLRVATVTQEFLRTLGVSPKLGRDFSNEGSNAQAAPAVLLTDFVWGHQFSRDPAILSRVVFLNGESYAIVGVLPRDFEFPGNTRVDVLVTMRESAFRTSRVTRFYKVVGRLRPGATCEKTQAAINVINEELKVGYSRSFLGPLAEARVICVDLRDRIVANARPSLFALSGAVMLVLLIGCANISNLLLSRTIARQNEIAIRVALGADWAFLLRQLLIEGTLLGFSGGGVGLVLAFGGVQVLRALVPATVPHIGQIHIDAVVLGFTILTTIGSSVFFGVVPLRRVLRIDLECVLHHQGLLVARERRMTANAIIIVEIALAFVLLAGAGLLIRTFVVLMEAPRVLHAKNVLAAQVTLPYYKYRKPEQRRTFFEALIDRIQAGPGTTSVGLAGVLPFEGFVMLSKVEIDGKTFSFDSRVNVNYASIGYFQTLGIPLLTGRLFNEADRSDANGVAIVNEAFVSSFLPDGRSPLDRRIKLGNNEKWVRIVGVVRNVNQLGLMGKANPEVFRPATQSDVTTPTVVIRSSADERLLSAWLRVQIRALDKDVALPEIQSMEARIASLAAPQRFIMQILLFFAGTAVSLSAVGIYGVLMHFTEQHRRELAVRYALGARQLQLAAVVLKRGLFFAMAGSSLGFVGTLSLTQSLRSLLYGVTPHDPATLGCGFGLVLLVSLGAAYLPARNAMRLDPMVTLRRV